MSDRMSSDKWRVRKLVYPDGLPGTYPWHVIPPGMPTPRDPHEAYRFHDERITAWRTHRMALTEAFYEIMKGIPMSDRMSVTEAQTYLDTWSTGDSEDMWKTRAARTIVHQAAQIERIQAALSKADLNWHVALGSEYEISTYESLLPGDMEPPA